MSSRILVADAGAMIAVLRDEPGADVFEAVVGDLANTTYAHAANLVEVFCEFLRSDGEDDAQTALRSLSAARILFREDLDRGFWEDAGRIKADYRRVSLADCFGLALARRLKATFLSTDHHELEAIHAAGVATIEFIR